MHAARWSKPWLAAVLLISSAVAYAQDIADGGSCDSCIAPTDPTLDVDGGTPDSCNLSENDDFDAASAFVAAVAPDTSQLDPGSFDADAFVAEVNAGNTAISPVPNVSSEDPAPAPAPVANPCQRQDLFGNPIPPSPGGAMACILTYGAGEVVCNSRLPITAVCNAFWNAYADPAKCGPLKKALVISACIATLQKKGWVYPACHWVNLLTYTGCMCMAGYSI